MKLKILFLFLFFLSISSGSYSQLNERKKGNAEPVAVVNYPEGIVYALPRTVVVVSVNVQKETFIPGPYAAYAKKYLGYTSAETQKYTSWSISGIDIATKGEPDPLAMFKGMDSVASRLSLLSDGRILGIEVSSIQCEEEMIKRNFIINEQMPKVPFTDLSSTDEYDIIVDQAAGSEKLVGKSFETKAQEAADYLIHLRKKRAYTLLSPTDLVPEDGLGYQVFIQEAQRLEKEYTELFLGKVFRSEHQFVFEYLPSEKESKNEILFRFSEDKGVLPVSDVSGRPIVLDLTRNSTSFAKAQELKSSINPKAGQSGIYYRIPVVGELTVSNGLQPLFQAKFPVAQFGALAPLPENLLNGKYSVEFDPITGTIKQIRIK
jgi:hypothetical protein